MYLSLDHLLENKINILLNLGITLFGGWFGVGPLLSRGGLLLFGFTGSHNFFYFTFQVLLLLGVHRFCNFRVADIKTVLYKTDTEDILINETAIKISANPRLYLIMFR